MNAGSPMRPSTPIHPHPPRPRTDAESLAEMDKVAELATRVIVSIARYWRDQSLTNEALLKQSVKTVLIAVAESDK